MRAKFVNEKFEQDSDPIQDMGIGAISKIKEWLRFESLNVYDINEDGTINLGMSLYRDGLYNMTWHLPEYINFKSINGTLEIINCKKITSLRGFPESVSGNVRIYENGKRFKEKDVREVIKHIGGELEVLSSRQKAVKLYRERGALKTRTSHKLEKTVVTPRFGRSHTQYSKGYSLYKTLEFIESAGNKGRKRRDILRFRYELAYGPGSYDEPKKYYDKYYNRFFDVNRGWGSDLFKSSTYFSQEGIIRQLATQRQDKTWVLNSEGKKRLKEYKELFEK